MQHPKGIPAEEARNRLVAGNELFVRTGLDSGNYSEERRVDTAENGQSPYAVIISCSDSRVIPEAIFSAGIGDLFVIRSAGNTIDTCALGSIEYAVEHLGCNLVIVMGHTGCGAVTAALMDHKGLKVTSILDQIRDVAGGETDHTRVAELNALGSVRVIAEDLRMDEGVEVVGAMYDIRTGAVRFLDGRLFSI